MNIFKLSYKKQLSILTILFTFIILLVTLFSITYSVINIKLINKKIDNSSQLLLLSNSIRNYQQFLNNLNANIISSDHYMLIQEHKNLYFISMNLIHNLLIQFEMFNNLSNNQEILIIRELYNIQTKISTLSFRTDQFLYQSSKINFDNRNTLINYFQTDQDQLQRELILLSELNQNDIKSHFQKFILISFLFVSSLCLIGLFLFIRFKHDLMKNLRKINYTQSKTSLNEITFLIEKYQAQTDIIKKHQMETNNCNIILAEKSNQLKQITEQLIYTQENERQNISQFIHNDLGQYLTALNLEIAHLNSKFPTQNIAKHAADLVQMSLQKIREISKYIHPPQINEIPFDSVLKSHADEILPKNIELDLSLNNFKDHMISNDKKLALFRTFQEALTNVIRHSNASKIFASLSLIKGTIFLSIKDNGTGLDNYTPSTGLIGIKHRISLLHGSFKILENSPLPGTEIAVSLPVKS